VTAVRHRFAGGRAFQKLPAWQWYLLACAVPAVLAPFFLASEWAHAAINVSIAYASAVIALGRFRAGRGVPVAWLWIAAGAALNATGGISESISEQVFHSDAYPTPADAFYLAIYPCVSVGLLMIVRHRNPGIGTLKLIDASTLTVGMGLLCWVYLIEPNAGATDSLLARVVNIAYPVGDLMLLAILARVLTAGGWRTPTVRLILAMLLAFFIGDVTWSTINHLGWTTNNHSEALINNIFIAGYALLGAAALHPSSRDLGTSLPSSGERMSRPLLAMLSLASLVAPAVLLVQAIGGHVRDGVAIAICSAQLTALVIARMGFLLRQIQRQSAKLRDLALEDPLTGLPNRRALQAHLANSLELARRHSQPLSLVMLDLDHFKRFNDEFGHVAGDHLLKSAAAAWSGQLRAIDMLARVGGEEFVLVLPNTCVREVDVVLSRLQSVTPLGQTFSAGVAAWDGVALHEELIRAADDAMYRAKRHGRNRIERARSSAA
jgi:diguanylate cyclase (GGDEF)-like protein